MLPLQQYVDPSFTVWVVPIAQNDEDFYAAPVVSEFYTEYDFGMTDSKMGIEILVGWRKSKFDQAIYTQRRAFQIGNINLRPGGLLSIRQIGHTQYENFLFLHTDSGKTKKDYTNRQAMLKKVFSLNNALKGLPTQQGESRLIALGDLNTMGRTII